MSSGGYGAQGWHAEGETLPPKWVTLATLAHPTKRWLWSLPLRREIAAVVELASLYSDKPVTAVDVGSGYGLWTALLAAEGVQTAGIERDIERVQWAREHFGSAKATYHNASIGAVAKEWSGCSLALVSWCPPGMDWRSEMTTLAPQLLWEIGMPGGVGTCVPAPYRRVAQWRTPSWVDVLNAFLASWHAGRAEGNVRWLPEGNTINTVFVRQERLTAAVKIAWARRWQAAWKATGQAPEGYPWETEYAALGLLPATPTVTGARLWEIELFD